VHGLDFIMKLKPISYTLEVRKLDAFRGKKEDPTEKESVDKAEQVLHNGFIAQDVEKAANAVHYNFSGLSKPKNDSDTYGLGYTDFVVPLVKAVQEQQQIIDSSKRVIALLQTKLDSMQRLNSTQTGKIDNLQNQQTQAKKDQDTRMVNDEAEIAALKKLVYRLTEKAEATKK
jgi:hypothetical protein